MSGYYSLGLSTKFPEFKPIPLFAEFSKTLPNGQFLEALSADGDRDIIRFGTGSLTGVLDVFKTSVVEIENDDLSRSEVDFFELWDRGGNSISDDLWAALSADILVPHEDAERHTFRDFSVISLWDALALFYQMKSDPDWEQHVEQIHGIMEDFARAIEMQAIVTIG